MRLKIQKITEPDYMFAVMSSMEEEAEMFLSWSDDHDKQHPYLVRLLLSPNVMPEDDYFYIIEHGSVCVEILIFDTEEEKAAFEAGEFKVNSRIQIFKSKQ